MFNLICMGLGYEHEPDFEIDRRDGYPHYLALLIRTKCRLKYRGEIQSYPPNTFILYDKNAPQFYAADGETYIDAYGTQRALHRSEALVAPVAAWLGKGR